MVGGEQHLQGAGQGHRWYLLTTGCPGAGSRLLLLGVVVSAGLPDLMPRVPWGQPHKDKLLQESQILKEIHKVWYCFLAFSLARNTVPDPQM